MEMRRPKQGAQDSSHWGYKLQVMHRQLQRDSFSARDDEVTITLPRRKGWVTATLGSCQHLAVVEEQLALGTVAEAWILDDPWVWHRSSVIFWPWKPP